LSSMFSRKSPWPRACAMSRPNAQTRKRRPQPSYAFLQNRVAPSLLRRKLVQIAKGVRRSFNSRGVARRRPILPQSSAPYGSLNSRLLPRARRPRPWKVMSALGRIRDRPQCFTLPGFGKGSGSAILVMQFCLDEGRKNADDEDPEDNHGRRVENEGERTP